VEEELMFMCLECGVRWGNMQASEDHISHGFCKKCVREKVKPFVWRKQEREGYSSCFARGYEDCTEYMCAFRDNCMEACIHEWEVSNLAVGGMKC
jgi:hypothetical protein